MNQIDDLRAVLSALRGLRRRLPRVTYECLAQVINHPVDIGLDAGDFCFIATCLDDAAQTAIDRRPERKCVLCGCQLANGINPARPDARYCSNSCRQKAYRQRVTDRQRDGATDVSRNDTSNAPRDNLSVTEQAA